MATTLDTLLVRFEADTTGLKTGIVKANSKIESFTKNFTKNFGAISLAVAGVTAAIAKMGSTIIEFEKLEASLRTVTGSATIATRRFIALQTLAQEMPFSVQELTSAFIKLKSLGLSPSQDALLSYGNTALAMGKSLNMFIEAIADAATGEFERLKEFGIKASSQGEAVVFTFQGMSTKVGKNAKEIEGYLRSIGKVQFAGAIEEQAGTLNIAWSNLGDATDNLVKTIGDAGLTDILIGITNLLKKIVNFVKQVITGFRIMGLSVIELAANFNAVITGMAGFSRESEKWRKTAQQTVEKINELSLAAKGVGEAGLPEGDISPGTVALQQRLEALEKSLKTEREIEIEAQAIRLNDIQAALKAKLITKQDAQRLEQESLVAHQKKLKEIQSESNKPQEELASELASFQDSLMGKEELENLSFERSLERIREFQEAKLITLEEANQLEFDLWLNHQARLTELETDSQAERASIVSAAQGKLMSDFENFFSRMQQLRKVDGLAQVGVATNAFSTLLSASSKHSKKMFEINKVAGIANAVVSTAQGVTKALGSFAPPFNFAMAAAVGAAGFAQIQSIRSTQFGGGGGGGGGAAAAPTGAAGATAAAEPATINQNVLDVNISTSGGSTVDIFDLIAKINEAQDDGAVIRNFGVA